MLELRNYEVIGDHGYFCNTLGLFLPRAGGVMKVLFYDEREYVSAVDYAIMDGRMYLEYEVPNFYA